MGSLETYKQHINFIIFFCWPSNELSQVLNQNQRHSNMDCIRSKHPKERLFAIIAPLCFI